MTDHSYIQVVNYLSSSKQVSQLPYLISEARVHE